MTATLNIERVDPTRIPAAGVAEAWRVDPEQGLDAAEVELRRERFGPNTLREKPPVPAWRRFLRQFADPLVYLLLGAIVISLAAWAVEGAAEVPIDAIVIGAIVLANAFIGFVQENRAERAVAALADMTAVRCRVLRDGRLTQVPSSELVPGDVLDLAEGDAVGADARLVRSASLRVQEASLTGESEATEKDPAALDGDVPLGDRHNMVFKGTAVVHGGGRAIVTSTGMDTEMGRIASLLDETTSQPSPLQLEIAKVSRMLGLLVTGIAVVVMITLALVNGVRSLAEATDILLLGLSLAVAAVPEGLPAILSLVLAIGVQAMARRNAVMKSLHSVGTLGSVSVICSDKTGTLTRNEMTLREVVTASGRTILSGTGYAPEGTSELVGDDAGMVAAEALRVLAGGVLANNAQLNERGGRWEIQGDPTEGAFLAAQHKLDGVRERVAAYARQAEAPFSSSRKMMSILGRREEDGIHRVFTKGAPDILLERCTAEQVGDGIRPLTAEHRARILDAVRDLGGEGYRTLGVAWREGVARPPGEFGEDAEHDLVYAGTVGIIDPPREEAVAAIAEAGRAGVRTVMITGDHPVTAARIASDLGIVRGAVAVTGSALEAMDPAALRETVRDARVFARVAPEHKLRIVDALQAGGEVVAMTGDGVNDAPALKAADIGVAMGITGTEVTKEAGDMILGDDNYATIVAAIRQGRTIFDNIGKSIRYLLGSNMGEVVTVFVGVVLGGVLGIADPAHPGLTVVPLLATQILWINLVTDAGPALAMGVDPAIDDVMGRRPRRPDEHLLDRTTWVGILRTGFVMGVVCLFVYDLCLPGGLVGGLDGLVGVEDQFGVARTMVFTVLVFLQLFNALNSRSVERSAFVRLFSNGWLWLSIAFAVVTQVLVVEVPVLQSAFGTTPLDALHWLVAVAAGATVLVVEEAVKLVRRCLADAARSWRRADPV